jgi:hypothetical protein
MNAPSLLAWQPANSFCDIMAVSSSLASWQFGLFFGGFAGLFRPFLPNARYGIPTISAWFYIVWHVVLLASPKRQIPSPVIVAAVRALPTI